MIDNVTFRGVTIEEVPLTGGTTTLFPHHNTHLVLSSLLYLKQPFPGNVF
jgi:hypothetical protein